MTNRVVRLFGKDEAVRWMNIALYQGAPAKKGLTTLAMAASANPILANKGSRDPTLFCTGYKRQRFYLFTRSEPEYVRALPVYADSANPSFSFLGTANSMTVTSSTRSPLAKNNPSQPPQSSEKAAPPPPPTPRSSTPQWETSISGCSPNRPRRLSRISWAMRGAGTSRVSFFIV